MEPITYTENLTGSKIVRMTSPVLTAMGVPSREALSAVRLSLGRWTTHEDITQSAELLAAAVQI